MATNSQPSGGGEPALAPTRILVVKLADLGDVLTITPAVRAMHRAFPEARIDVLVNPHTRAILSGADFVDNIISFPKTSFEGLAALYPQNLPPLIRHLHLLRRNQYDTVVNCHHLTTPLGRAKQRALLALTGAQVTVGLDNGHGGWLTHKVTDEGFGIRREVEYWLALAQALGAKTDNDPMHCPASPHDNEMVATMLKRHALAPQQFVVLHAGSGGFSPARRWDPHKFAEIASLIEAHYGLPSVLVGAKGDDAQAVMEAAKTSLTDLSGRTSIGELAALLTKARLFVGADSGVMHVAAAARTPMVAIFGPTNHLAWAPWTPLSPSRVVRLGISCSPCAYTGHSVGWRNGCPERACLGDLSPQRVLPAIDQVLRLSS